MEDQPKITFETDGDALADAAQAANLFAVRGGERRVDRSEKERARQANALESLAEDARLQCFDVDGDIGELGHGDSTGGEPIDPNEYVDGDHGFRVLRRVVLWRPPPGRSSRIRDKAPPPRP